MGDSQTKYISCTHGVMQQLGLNYWETYVPVVNWISIHTLIAVSPIYDIHSISTDFVLGSDQSKLDFDVFTEMTMGMDIDSTHRG